MDSGSGSGGSVGAGAGAGFGADFVAAQAPADGDVGPAGRVGTACGSSMVEDAMSSSRVVAASSLYPSHQQKKRPYERVKDAGPGAGSGGAAGFVRLEARGGNCRQLAQGVQHTALSASLDYSYYW